MAGAMRVARALGPGHTVVTMLCDLADRYASKLYNPPFLRGEGLPSAPWLEEGAGGDGQRDALREALREAVPAAMAPPPDAP